MYRASSLINKHGMHILYYSLFMPDIMYCAEVWGNTYATNIHCLVLLQKRVIRLICGAKRLDHTNLLSHNVQWVISAATCAVFSVWYMVLTIHVPKLMCHSMFPN